MARVGIFLGISVVDSVENSHEHTEAWLFTFVEKIIIFFKSFLTIMSLALAKGYVVWGFSPST